MKINVKKLAVDAMLVALAVSLPSLAVLIEVSRYFPIQYLVNVVVGVFLSPGCGTAMMFCTLLIRSLMDTGGLLTFPGSMIGTLVCDLAHRYPGELMLAYVEEAFDTGIVDGILCYPMAATVMGKEAAISVYVMPFLMSTLYDTMIATSLTGVLYKSGALKYMKHLLDTDIQPSKAVGKQMPAKTWISTEKQVTAGI